MREIIQVSIGQCGNRIAKHYWQNLCNQHNIDFTGHKLATPVLENEHVETYFRETSDNRYVPRSLLVDLDPDSIHAIQSGNLGKLFDPDHAIYGSTGSGGIYSQGYYGYGQQIYYKVEDKIRREAERCDRLQGIQVSHSLAGGTGSGLGSLFFNKMRDLYLCDVTTSYSILPSQSTYTHPLAIYNSALTMYELLYNVAFTVLFDNDSLLNACGRSNQNQLKKPTFSDMNQIVANTMTDITVGNRFSGPLNAGYNKLNLNLIPFCWQHFLVAGISPLASSKRNSPLSTLTKQAFDYNSFSLRGNHSKAKFIGCHSIFRGKQLSTYQAQSQIGKFKQRCSDNFNAWNQTSISYCNTPRHSTTSSVTSIVNSTAVSQVIDEMRFNLSKLLDKKVYLHWYYQSGGQLEMFQNVNYQLGNISQQYNSYVQVKSQQKEDCDDEQ